MIIKNYISPSKIEIMFLDKNRCIKTTSYDNFIKGITSNPYKTSYIGFGYIGKGIYNSKTKIKGKRVYFTWKSMISRVINVGNECYRNVKICKEWENFQNFAYWFEKNYYVLKNESIELDKDLLSGKLYSPDTCVFLPMRLNNIVKKYDKKSNLPVGVYNFKKTNKFVSRYKNENKKNVHIGYFNTIEEAYENYKINKNRAIKKVLENYRNEIPENVFIKIEKNIYL